MLRRVGRLRVALTVLAVMEDGRAIEAATIGNKGIVGLTAFVGGAASPNEDMVQVEGDALRMDAGVLEQEARPVLVRCNSAFQTQVSHSVACNGLHTIEKRCCRC